MPGFSIAKFIAYVFLIGFLWCVLTFAIFDQLSPPMNTFIQQGLVSQMGVDMQNVCSIAINCYAVLALILTGLGFLIAENANTERPGTSMNMSMRGFLTCGILIGAATVANFAFSVSIDPVVASLTNGLPVQMGGQWDYSYYLAMFFAIPHLVCGALLLCGYLYMVLNTVSIESIEYAEPTYY